MAEHETDRIAPDEDIDVMHEVDHLRIERLSESGLYLAGYNEGDDPDYRYWLACDSGGLRIERTTERSG